MAFGSIDYTGNPPSHIALTTNGPLLSEPIDTVLHVYWNGTQLVDTKNNTWTMTGTVPQITTSPLLYNGQNMRNGAGPFSDNNYYTVPNSTLPSVTKFGGIIVFNPQALSNSPFVLSCTPDNTTKGFSLRIESSLVVLAVLPVDTYSVSSSPILNGVNVVTFGWTNNSGGSVSLNGINSANSSASSWTQDTLDSFYLGRYGPTTSYSFNGTIYEILLSAGLGYDSSGSVGQYYCDAVFGQLTSEGAVFTVTR